MKTSAGAQTEEGGSVIEDGADDELLSCSHSATCCTTETVTPFEFILLHCIGPELRQ